MARRHHHPAAESSDDEAPEAITFGSSKQAAKGDQQSIQQYHIAKKQRLKEKNRAIDRALKERSTKTKQSRPAKKSRDEAFTSEEHGSDENGDEDNGSGGDGPTREALEDRMARAMKDAEEESDLEGVYDDEMSDEEGQGSSVSEEASSGEEDSEEDEDMDDNEEYVSGDGGDDDDEDEDMASESADDEDLLTPSATKTRNYLPEHLFKSALKKPNKIVFNEVEDVQERHSQSMKPKKRKRPGYSAKDIIVGSRTIRTLSKPSNISAPVAKGLVPQRRVEKFVKTSLNVRGDAAKSRTRGWTRQPAHLGVMRRNGPAPNFVRNS